MANAMPLIPGLAGAPPSDDEAEPASGVAAALDAISDEDLAALEAAAADAKASGALDAILGAPPGEVEHDEATETPEEELGESDEQQAEEEAEGEEDPVPHIRAAEDAARAAQAACQELESLIEEAKQHAKAGVDVKALKGLLDDAEDAAGEAQSAADDAYGLEDAAKAAELAQAAGEAQARAEAALAEAKGQVLSDAAEANKTAVPQDVLDMTAWAKKITGGAMGM